MKYQKRIKIPGAVGLLVALFVIIGCQLPPEKRDTAKEMQAALQKGSNDNALINKGAGSTLPPEVRQAFMPRAEGHKGSQMPVAEKRIDLVAEQIPARTFFLNLVEGTPYNITVHPGVEGKISLQLRKVTIPEVLETVRSVYGYDFRQTPQGIEVLPATLQTRAFAVNYLDIQRGGSSSTQVSAGSLKSGSSGGSSASGAAGAASGSGGASASGGSDSGGSSANSKITTNSKADFWVELRTSVETIIGTGDGRRVSVSPLAGLIVVQAMPDELKRVEDYLKSAELSLNRQVILEAKILEVELDDSFQAGINWGLISGRISAASVGNNVAAKAFNLGDTFPVSLGTAPTVNVTPGQVDGVSTMASGTGSLGGAFALATNFKHLGSFIELLGEQGKVHVLSNPRVTTMNNQKALIKVGTEQFYVTNVTSTTTTGATAAGGSASTPTVTFDSFFSGIALDVTPHITAENEITLHIHPTVSQVSNQDVSISVGTGGAAQEQKFPLAKSSIRESDSLVKARNGEMVIIGGLMQKQTSDLKAGVPVLKDLPLLGSLFRRTVQVNKKVELVILVRPIVVDNHTPSEIIDDTLDRFNRMNE